MSNQSPYELLGVTEDSSFEEIQAAKVRLGNQYAGDRTQLAQLEAAYDSVLMQRLKLRQEGKIKVPDKIRYAERSTTAPQATQPQAAMALKQWFELPPVKVGAIGASAIVGLMGLSLGWPRPDTLQLVLVVALGASAYWLYRKQNQFWRAVGVSFASLLGGFALGCALTGLVVALPQVSGALGARQDGLTIAITVLVMGLVSLLVR
jgi:hypothetical protein